MTPEEKIIQARKNKGYTQTEMAEFLAKNLGRFSLRQYQRIENGEFPKFKKEVIQTVENLLDISIYDMIYDNKRHVVNEQQEVYGGNTSEIIDLLKSQIKTLEKHCDLIERNYQERLRNMELSLKDNRELLKEMMAQIKGISLSAVEYWSDGDKKKLVQLRRTLDKHVAGFL